MQPLAGGLPDLMWETDRVLGELSVLMVEPQLLPWESS